MDELLEQFLVEGRELVQQAADDLLALEQDAGDFERIDSAFRAVHTFKGAAALFQFAPIETSLHAAEDVLGAMRDRRLATGPSVIGGLLNCIGRLDAWLESVARTGDVPPNAADDARDVVAAMLRSLAAAKTMEASRTSQHLEWLPDLLSRDPSALVRAHKTATVLTAVRYVPHRECFFLGDDPLALVRTVPNPVIVHVAAARPATREEFDPFACNLVIEMVAAASLDHVRGIFRLVADQVEYGEILEPVTASEPATIDMSSFAARRTLRIDAARIDALIDILGELIVVKNRLAHLAATLPDVTRTLVADVGELDRLTSEMHRAVRTARMVPLTQTMQRFPRLLRDIAGKLDKPIQLEVSGAEVEADKSVVDGLFEPLLHLLRNAADHGIEAPALRREAGKPETGRVGLRVLRGGDQIVISVVDDGAGIDPAKVREAARQRGLMPPDALAALADSEVIDLIFAPGFSTAATVTSVSGRGVGLDVVRSAVQGLGGRVTVSSLPGSGSTIRLTLPQTVAMTTVLVVQVGSERFGVPMDAVVEIARVEVDCIVAVRDGHAFVLRDRTIPLLRLADLLRIPGVPRRTARATVLIVGVGDEQVGVEIEKFQERIEVVVRPLGGLLAAIPGMLGAALLGDGLVLMVLNIVELLG